ncbi:helix-turn-helix domain-containing protein [Sinosporangium siamense]|uniref:AraC family transcriptional regulator n=2 Tax=Sinosporangium siamense TaxID=1367973 RepID=A0A919RI67_9ACTN|nr:AraC family transcriptional regulator [Sinosporangium siamense]GII92834.1 AraC family transcriptional regulator [Sinosporangium siamense]
MGEVIEQAIRRAINRMYENIGEQLTIDDMARTAMFSKFHFSRVFRQVTGVSPGRFLSAVRLQEAKRLLLSTSLSVADISNRVGYTSVGTFSTRFKSSVGVAPTQYRQLRGVRTDLVQNKVQDAAGHRAATLRGKITFPQTGEPGRIFIGLFPDWIPQGAPVRSAVLSQPGPYTLTDVAPGIWYVLAHSMPHGKEDLLGDDLLADPASCVGTHGPITVGPESVTISANVNLRPMRGLDPPVLHALLDTRRSALSAQAS